MTPEERILDRINVGELSAEQREQYLSRIAETVASRLMLDSVQAFHELEIGRLEYMIEQGETDAVDQELHNRVNSAELIAKIEDDIVAEITDYQAKIMTVASQK